MSVEIRLFGTIREAVGERTLEKNYNSCTIQEVIDILIEEYPELEGEVIDENGLIPESVNIMVNTKNIQYIDGIETRVTDGDNISVATAITGG
jgi:molybdopterin synthase sulfur carrier subunit